MVLVCGSARNDATCPGEWIGLLNCGFRAKLDRHIGCCEPYATSHAALDRDEAVQEEVRNVVRAVTALRRGEPSATDAGLRDPGPQ